MSTLQILQMLHYPAQNCLSLCLRIPAAHTEGEILTLNKQRRLQAGNLLREIVQAHTSADLLLIDNIELLFDAALDINPLDLLRRQAHARPVVAAWPGDYREEGKWPRLGYAQNIITGARLGQRRFHAGQGSARL